MKIRLLKNGYEANENLYKDFMNNRIDFNADYFSDEYIELGGDLSLFPIYMARLDDDIQVEEYKKAVYTIMEDYLDYGRDVYMNEILWHSLIMYHCDYLIEKYGDLINSHNNFKNIIIKKFNWESYIYKCIIMAEYLYNSSLDSKEDYDYYIQLFVENMDVFNYIIKYAIFKNDIFLLNFFKVIDELDISSIMKAKIKDLDLPEKDPRYGRRVIFELNKNYPAVMAPFMTSTDLADEIIKALSLYVDRSVIENIRNKNQEAR